MKWIAGISFLLIVSCTNKRKAAIEEAIQATENRKGYTIKGYDIISEQQSHDTLIVRYSATVISSITLQEITDFDFVKFKVVGDDLRRISNY